jgi:hypothetical protein
MRDFVADGPGLAVASLRACGTANFGRSRDRHSCTNGSRKSMNSVAVTTKLSIRSRTLDPVEQLVEWGKRRSPAIRQAYPVLLHRRI